MKMTNEAAMETVEKKNAAVVYADAERGVLGLRSRILQRIGGKTVLERTLGRLARSKRLDEILVFCPEGQADRVREAAGGGRMEIIPLKQPVSRSAGAARRKWSLASWRGGLGEATVFDEFPGSGEMMEHLRERKVFTAAPVPAEAVLADPELLDGMLEHHHEHGQEMRFTFSQAAPGFLPCAFRLDLYYQAVMSGALIGDVLAYHPDMAHGDYINEKCCFKVPPAVSCSPVRYIADTQRSLERLEALLGRMNGGGETVLAEAAAGMMEEMQWDAERLPRELEVEITTSPSFRANGYPHRGGIVSRGEMRVEQFRKIVEDCRGYDDICLTIGGFGEPLAHGGLLAMIEAAHEGGIFGIHVETDGLLLKGELAERLAESRADVVSVWLDANSPQAYQKMKGEDRFAEALGNVEDFLARSKKTGGPRVVPCLTKTKATLPDMEGFYDRWLREAGQSVITGYNDFAGQMEDLAVMDMSPPGRYACGRLWRCMTILADGTVPVCQQDFRGNVKMGNVFEASVSDIWQGGGFQGIRRAHKQGEFEKNELCSRCKEWHR